ncbi:MAG: hypothetical protein H0U71_09675 [Gammaproteobacteria bacterium]|nr:hypothetical protein [Gammaproteobacteria bacterium]
MFLSHFMFELIVLVLGIGLLIWFKGKGIINNLAKTFAYIIIIVAAIAMVYHLFHG